MKNLPALGFLLDENRVTSHPGITYPYTFTYRAPGFRNAYAEHGMD